MTAGTLEDGAWLGVTRLADTTGLDRLGIPTASCVRPGTLDSLTVYSGKGDTFERARTSALAECVERTSALWNDDLVHVASRRELEASGEVVWGPERFTERHADVSVGTCMPWVRTCMVTGPGRCWVPADRVFIGHRPPGASPAGAVVTTNGLGCARTVDAAMTHALLELVERDVVSCAELEASDYAWGLMGHLAERLGLDSRALATRYRDAVDVAETIDPRTLPPSAAALHARFDAAGIDVTIKALPNDLDVPVYGAAAIEQLSFSSYLAAAGYAARLDPEAAVVDALLELAQSRATDIQGAREDVGEHEKRRLDTPPPNHWLLTPGARRQPFPGQGWRPGRVNAPGWRELLGRLAGVGLDAAAAVDLTTHPELPVVRVLVPGIETWHPTGGEARLGPRAQRRVRHEQPAAGRG